MDNEYDLLSKNNQKYSIEISDCKARLRAIDKDLRNELFSVRISFFFCARLNNSRIDRLED
jgi:hypothetical protein